MSKINNEMNLKDQCEKWAVQYALPKKENESNYLCKKRLKK